MRAALLVLSLVWSSNGNLPGEQGGIDPAHIPVLHQHFRPEYTFDIPTDLSSWAKVRAGLNVAFGSTDELYLRCEVPQIKQPAEVWEASGWRGERLNAQLLVWSGDAHEQVRVEAGDLKNGNGQMIGGKMRVSSVRYVLSNFPYQAQGFTCEVTNKVAFLMPDRLEAFDRFDLPAKTVRPVWLSVEIPDDAEPGDYNATVQVESAKEARTLNMKIHVQRAQLPKPAEWMFRLDLWQNPWVVSSYFQVEPWSEEHKTLLKKHLKLYADAGGKYISTYTVHSPWSDNSYTLEGTMIEWIKTKNGGWKFDYSIFDQYVDLAMEAGVDEAITVYTPIPWGHRFRYLDEGSGNYVDVEWSPKSEEFKEFWNVFLSDLMAHLKEKGWFSKTYLGINENPMDLTLAAAQVVKTHSKEWKITYAGDWHSELSLLLDDYSCIITREPDLKGLQERRERGFTTTFYVCCNPPRPNNFVFSAPVEGRYIGWYTAAFGYSGFLRWAYDAWPADPMRDARHTLWPAGDCFLVYPGGNSCIRFEKLREGIVDFEKIRILRDVVARSSDGKSKALMKKLEEHLSTFTREPDYSKRDYSVPTMVEAVERGKRLLDELSAATANKN